MKVGESVVILMLSHCCIHEIHLVRGTNLHFYAAVDTSALSESSLNLHSKFIFTCGIIFISKWNIVTLNFKIEGHNLN